MYAHRFLNNSGLTSEGSKFFMKWLRSFEICNDLQMDYVWIIIAQFYSKMNVCLLIFYQRWEIRTRTSYLIRRRNLSQRTSLYVSCPSKILSLTISLTLCTPSIQALLEIPFQMYSNLHYYTSLRYIYLLLDKRPLERLKRCK